MTTPRQCEGCCNVVTSLPGCKGGKAGAFCLAFHWNLENRVGFIDGGWKCSKRGIPVKVVKTESRRETPKVPDAKDVVVAKAAGPARRGIRKL